MGEILNKIKTRNTTNIPRKGERVQVIGLTVARKGNEIDQLAT